MKPRQLLALRAVDVFEREHGAASVRNVQKWCGWSSTSVADYWLRFALKDGQVERVHFGLKLTPAGRAVMEQATRDPLSMAEPEFLKAVTSG